MNPESHTDPKTDLLTTKTLKKAFKMQKRALKLGGLVDEMQPIWELWANEVGEQ